MPRDHPVYKRYSVHGALGRLIRSEEHEELVGGGRAECVAEGGHMRSRGLLQLLRCVRWGGRQVGHQVPHRCLVGAPVEVGVPLLQRGHVQGWEGLHRDCPEEAQGAEHEVVGVKRLDGRIGLMMSHCKLQPVGGVAPANRSGRPRLRWADIGRSLGGGLGGEGMSWSHSAVPGRARRREAAGKGAKGRVCERNLRDRAETWAGSG